MTAHKAITVIEISDESLQAIGRWPWPWHYHAEMIKVLDQWGAKAIVFDLVFKETDTPYENDALLKTLKGVDRVYFPVSLEARAEKKIWVQISKNFEPFIPMTQVEAQEMLLDFNEKMEFKASDLGTGRHKIGAEVYVSWLKHDYTDSFDEKSNSKEIEVEITK